MTQVSKCHHVLKVCRKPEMQGTKWLNVRNKLLATVPEFKYSHINPKILIPFVRIVIQQCT